MKTDNFVVDLVTGITFFGQCVILPEDDLVVVSNFCVTQ